MSGNSPASLARKSALACAIAAALTTGQSARAQDAPAEEAADAGEIIVTGSRIAREATDASTPLAIISSEEIKLSGAMTVDEVLNESPQFVSATNGGATANTVPAGSAAGAAYVNLRGFGPTRSLTLVNGRRFAIFGPEQVTDLNTIPTALIERTEVVTGGSSGIGLAIAKTLARDGATAQLLLAKARSGAGASPSARTNDGADTRKTKRPPTSARPTARRT